MRKFNDKPKCEKFVVVGLKGEKKEYKQYSRACSFLDKTYPDTAIRGFIIDYSDDKKTGYVRHA